MTAPVLPGFYPTPEPMDHPKAPETDKVARLVPELTAILRGGPWMSAKLLTGLMGVDDRTIRAIAAASGGHILSGQQGYRLTVDATPEEVRHAAAWLRHQARQMLERAAQIEAVR